MVRRNRDARVPSKYYEPLEMPEDVKESNMTGNIVIAVFVALVALLVFGMVQAQEYEALCGGERLSSELLDHSELLDRCEQYDGNETNN